MMFRALTAEEIEIARAAKAWANARIKERNAEIRAEGKELLASIHAQRRWYERKKLKRVTGTPCWVCGLRNPLNRHTTVDLLIDYNGISNYVRKLKSPKWKIQVEAAPGYTSEWALRIEYWRDDNGQRGRVIYEQMALAHRCILEHQPLPRLDLTGAYTT